MWTVSGTPWRSRCRARISRSYPMLLLVARSARPRSATGFRIETRARPARLGREGVAGSEGDSGLGAPEPEAGFVAVLLLIYLLIPSSWTQGVLKQDRALPSSSSVEVDAGAGPAARSLFRGFPTR